jgi:2',3'-cyclic-nucleotide 2'-phosphodiesterase (5'-nucleotidase family)
MKGHFTICIGVALLAAAGCGAIRFAEHQPTETGGSGRVTLLFSGDSRGMTEPVRECACYEKPVPAIGGLPRRASFVRGVRRVEDGVLLLDAGNTVVDPEETDAARAQPRRVASALGAMGYDAVALGPAELLAGAGGDATWVEALGAPLVAANLRGTALPEHQTSVTKVVGGVRVAVLGAATPSAIPAPIQARLDLRMDPVADVLAKQVSQLDAVDLVVVMLQGTFDEARELASALGGVDVIITGRSTGLLYDTARVGATLVVQALPEGKHVGRLRLEVHGRGRSTVLADERVALDDRYPDDPEVRELVGG